MSSPSSAGSSPAPDQAQGAPAGEEAAAAPVAAAELESSFFPAPPHFYKRYSDANLALQLDAIVPSEGPDQPSIKRDELEPPNIDWVVRAGRYEVFGEIWPVEEILPTLEELGVKELFTRGEDRSTSLLTLLRAMLLSYSSLVSSLLAPPPSLAVQQEEAPESERLVEHIRLISINMHFLVNELRPIQARETLRGMLRTQIETRRAKTMAIRQKCAELSESLSQLHLNLSAASAESTTSEEVKEDLPQEDAISVNTVDEMKRLRAAVDNMEIMEES